MMTITILKSSEPLKTPALSNKVLIREIKWKSTKKEKREHFSHLMLSEGGNEKGELWVNKWNPPMSLLEFLLHPPLHWCFIRPIIFSKIAPVLPFSLIFLSKHPETVPLSVRTLNSVQDSWLRCKTQWWRCRTRQRQRKWTMSKDMQVGVSENKDWRG